MNWEQILTGDCRDILPTLEAESVQCCVTSPPYWGLRDYGVEGALGLESTPNEYLTNMVAVFREVKRVLKPDATLWINLGDSYANDTKWGGQSGGLNRGSLNGNDALRKKKSTGLKPKDLCMMPARLAMALQADGWYLRSEIVWAKPNPMPESVTDRPTKSHEMIYLLAKQERYFYDAEAIREPGSESTIDRNNYRRTGNAKEVDSSFRINYLNPRTTEFWNGTMRNKRSVWTIATQAYPDSHFATFPEDLIKPCILAGSRLGDTVLDPFAGSGTTGKVALELGRRAILIELNPDYIELAQDRTFVTPGFL